MQTFMCNLTQPFGVNYNPSYKAMGLLGHTGIDIACGFGTDIVSLVNMFIYKVILPGSGFTGVFGIVDDGIELYELLLGHLDPSVGIGNILKGQKLGTEANHGTVYVGDIAISASLQKETHAGSHRHWQKRPIKRTQHLQGTRSEERRVGKECRL